MDPFAISIQEGFESQSPSPSQCLVGSIPQAHLHHHINRQVVLDEPPTNNTSLYQSSDEDVIPCVQPISRVVYESSDEDEIPCAQPISRVGYETSSDEDSQSTSASSQNIFQHHAQPLYDPNDSFESHKIMTDGNEQTESNFHACSKKTLYMRKIK